MREAFKYYLYLSINIKTFLLNRICNSLDWLNNFTIEVNCSALKRDIKPAERIKKSIIFFLNILCCKKMEEMKL